MEKALAGNLVAAPHHFRDNLRMVLADPAQNEERRLGADLVQQVEGQLRIALQPAFETVPVIRRHSPADGGDVAIILEDDREDVPSVRSRCLRGHEPSATQDGCRGAALSAPMTTYA